MSEISSLVAKDTPASVKDLFMYSWGLYKKNWKTYVKSSLLIGASVVAIMLVVMMLFAVSTFASDVTGDDSEMITTLAGVLAGVIMVACILPASFFWAAMLPVSAVKADAENVTTKEILKATKDAVRSLTIVFLQRGIICFFALFLLIIPSIILQIRYAFAPFVYLVDGQRGMKALAGSRDIMRGFSWFFVWRMLPTFLVGFAIGLAGTVGSLISIFVWPLVYTLYVYGMFLNIRSMKAAGMQTDGFTTKKKMVAAGCYFGLIAVSLAIFLIISLPAAFNDRFGQDFENTIQGYPANTNV
jgi:hypothetical protein